MSKFEEFNTTDATYKTVGDHKIDLTILTPKDLPHGRHPLMIRFHGGGLVTGARQTDDWFCNWILQYVQKKQAIIVTPDYRLMPEASGVEILEDLADLFKWIREELPFTLSAVGMEADLHNILTIGESAGGYLAVQAALLHHSSPSHQIKACISQYGTLDLNIPFWINGPSQPLMGNPTERPEVFDEHMAAVKAGKQPAIVSHAPPPARLDLLLSILQHGHYLEVFGRKPPELYPMANLDKLQPGNSVPMFIFHGDQDTAAPVENSRAFAQKLKAVDGSVDIHLSIQPGEHIFDREATIEDAWLKEGLEFIDKYWPSMLSHDL